MIWKKGATKETDDEAIRRILEAAASDEPPHAPPPFFANRIRAQAASLAAAQEHPVGLAAAHALPLLGVAVLCLAIWTGYETGEAAEEARDSLSRTLASPERIDEVLVMAMLLESGREAEK